MHVMSGARYSCGCRGRSSGCCGGGASVGEGLVRGEGEHLLDGVGVSQEHDQAVNAHAPATGAGKGAERGNCQPNLLICSWRGEMHCLGYLRRQTVFHGVDKHVVDALGFLITLILLPGLLFEPLLLVEGIVTV